MTFEFYNFVARLCLILGILTAHEGTLRNVYAQDGESGESPRRLTSGDGELRMELSSRPTLVDANERSSPNVGWHRPDRTYTNAESIQAVLDSADDIGRQFGPKDAIEVIGDAERLTYRRMQLTSDWRARGSMAEELTRLQSARTRWEMAQRYGPPAALETDDAAMRELLPIREGQFRGPVRGDTLNGRLPELVNENMSPPFTAEETGIPAPSLGQTLTRQVRGRVPGAAAAFGLGLAYEIDSGVPPEEAALDAAENAAPLLIPVVGEAYVVYQSGRMIYDGGQIVGATFHEALENMDGQDDLPLIEDRVREMILPSTDHMPEIGPPPWFDR